MLSRIVLKNIIYNSSSVLIQSLIGLIVVIFLARTLKPELFGLYSLSLSLVSVLAIFADLGINSAGTRYIADAVSKHDHSLAGGYFYFLINFKLILTLLVTILLFIFSETISSAFEKPISLLLKILCIYLLFNSFTSLLLAVANAMNDFKANLLINTLSSLSKLILTFLLVLLGLSVVGATLAFSLSALIGFLFAVYYLLRKYGIIFAGKKKIEAKRVLKFVFYSAVISITWVIFANVDMVMIGYFLSAEDVAYYRAGFSIISAITGFIAIPSVLLPVFVRLEGEDLSRAFSRAFKYSSALCIPSALGVMLISQNLILVAYGEDYLPGLRAMQILSILLISPAFGIYGSIFSGKERPELNFYPLLFAMVLNVLLNYLMIPPLGIIGASSATVISNALCWLILALVCAKEFGMKPKVDNLAKITFSAIVMFLIASNFNSMILIVPVAILVYSVTLFLVRGITKEDIEFIKRIVTD